MENEHLPEEILRLFARICRSELFWSLQQYMRGEGILLSYLYETPDGSTPKALAQVMNVSAARITVILGHLEHKRLITRTADKTDRRRIQIRLTENGRAQVEQIRRGTLADALRMCERLGAQDSEELIRIVDKMLDSETKLSADAVMQPQGAKEGTQ